MKRLWRKVDLWYCQQSPEQINGLSIRREKYQKFWLVGLQSNTRVLKESKHMN